MSEETPLELQSGSEHETMGSQEEQHEQEDEENEEEQVAVDFLEFWSKRKREQEKKKIT